MDTTLALAAQATGEQAVEEADGGTEDGAESDSKREIAERSTECGASHHSDQHATEDVVHAQSIRSLMANYNEECRPAG